MSSSPIEALYVVDTLALIWYLLGDKKLGSRALLIFKAAEKGQTRLILSSISLAELYYANGKHKLFPDFKTVYTNIMTMPYLRFVSFDARHVIDFDRDSAIPEMHDRIIAGLAYRLNAPLLTSDPLIIAAGIVRIEW